MDRKAATVNLQHRRTERSKVSRRLCQNQSLLRVVGVGGFTVGGGKFTVPSGISAVCGFQIRFASALSLLSGLATYLSLSYSQCIPPPGECIFIQFQLLSVTSASRSV